MPVPLDKPLVCPLLVGRTMQLSELRGAIDSARHGQGQTLLLTGEAGIGKSRLAAEAAVYAAAQGFQLLRASCFQPDTVSPYAPLVGLLAASFARRPAPASARDLDPLARDLLLLLPGILPAPVDLAAPAPLDPQAQHQRICAALTHYFVRQAQRQPTLLQVEDLQWSDEGSLAFLVQLAQQCAELPLLLLLTYRSDERSPRLRHWLAQLERRRLARELLLQRLSHDQSVEMIRSILGAAAPLRPAWLEAIVLLTEGNPFFIEELLSALPERWDAEQLRIPRSIQDAVQQRVQRLSSSARQVVAVAAVAGRGFDFALLQALTRLEERELVDVLKELIAAQLVVEESAERFTFRHALTRQAIYADLLLRERRALHHQIVLAVERLAGDALDVRIHDLAYHSYEAGEWAKALLYARRAGEQAQSVYAPYAAAEQLTRALVAAEQLEQAPAPELYLARGEAYETIGDFERAQADYQAAVERARAAGDVAAEWQALLALGLLWASRDYARTGALYQQALALAQRTGDLLMIAHSLSRIGNWHLNLDQPAAASVYSEQALALFRRANHRSGMAAALDLLGLARAVCGDLQHAVLHLKQALVLFTELDDRQARSSSLAVLTGCGGSYEVETLVPRAMSPAETLAAGEEALRLAREIGWRAGEAFALAQLALCLGSRGQYGPALEHAQRSLQIAMQIEHRQWLASAHATLGQLYLDLLAFGEARQHLEQARARACAIGSLHWERLTTGFLALTCIRQRAFERAEAVLSAALGQDIVTSSSPGRLVALAWAELALARGQAGRALLIVDQLIASAPNSGMGEQLTIPRLAGLRGQALSALKRWPAAERALLSAQQAAAAHGMAPLLWRLHGALGRLYQLQGRRADANREWATGRRIVEELAAGMPLPALQQTFLHLAARQLPARSPRRAARHAAGGLTPRERDVALLIAQGKTNQAIAAELTLSRRTVEDYVASIMAKLSFSARAQIAAWVVQQGLSQSGE